MPRLVCGPAQLRDSSTSILLPLVLMIGCFRRRCNTISDELLVGGANIGAITKRFSRITATSASGNGSFGLGSFPPRGVSAGNSPEKDSRYRSQCRASPRVVEINNHRPHQELYGKLFAMSPVSELLIRKLWRQASSNFTVSHVDLNKMERSEGYHAGSPSFAFYCSPIN